FLRKGEEVKVAYSKSAQLVYIISILLGISTLVLGIFPSILLSLFKYNLSGYLNLYICIMISTTANSIFQRAIADYHVNDAIDHPISNPYDLDSLEHLLYLKCWIDTAQWHMEDVVRNPDIDPKDGLY